MNNGNKPVYPSKNNNGGLHSEDDENYLRAAKKLTGLTKREYYAGLAMQGMAANLKPGKMDDLLDIPGNIAKWSVAFADELLKELDKSK